MINTGSSTATGCTIAPLTTVPATFVFRTTDPTTNAVIGSTNTPVDIPGGKAQTFVFAFTPTATFPPTDVQLQFDCANTEPALAISGINTLLLSASSTPVPDIVALAATLSNNGVVTTDASTGSGVFAVAAVNVGSSDTLTVTADTGAVSLPLSVSLCATDLTTGVCVNPTTPSNRVTVAINTNATPSFGIFVASTGSIPFDPAVNRIFVRFASANGVTRGATSVAVRRGDSANAAPISNAGPDQNVPMGTMVILDGSGSSDANGDQLTFAWAFVSVPTGSAATLANPTSVHPTFTADVAGSYSERIDVLSLATSTPAASHCLAMRWSLDDMTVVLRDHAWVRAMSCSTITRDTTQIRPSGQKHETLALPGGAHDHHGLYPCLLLSGRQPYARHNFSPR